MYKIDVKILDNRLGKVFEFIKYQTVGSCGIDLKAMLNHNIYIYPNQVVLIPTGIAIFIKNPEIAGIIIPRSGLGHKKGIILGNSVGLIDSDYQGELMVSLWNRSDIHFFIKPGYRIAQLIFVPIIKPVLNVVSSFKKTERNVFGFGHSGVL